MNDFLDDLHFFCTSQLLPPDTPVYKSAMETLCAMENQITQALGKGFCRQLDETVYEVYRWEILQAFQAGLRFGADFARTVWDHSSQTSEP